MEALRIVLADDHLLFRKAVAAVLATRPAYAVVSEASDGQEAIDVARAVAPDVILTVRGHVRLILEKLHLQNRVQAAVYAVRQGRVPPPQED